MRESRKVGIFCKQIIKQSPQFLSSDSRSASAIGLDDCGYVVLGEIFLRLQISSLLSFLHSWYEATSTSGLYQHPMRRCQGHHTVSPGLSDLNPSALLDLMKLFHLASDTYLILIQNWRQPRSLFSETEQYAHLSPLFAFKMPLIVRQCVVFRVRLRLTLVHTT